MAEIKLDWQIKNIGPHTDLEYEHDTNSIKIGIYANNGMGKTFISRAYRLASPSYEPEIETINNILTTNKTTGQFSLELKGQPTQLNKLGI